jgi:hypothetical protein
MFKCACEWRFTINGVAKGPTNRRTGKVCTSI